MWEFIGGKAEPGETRELALIHEGIPRNLEHYETRRIAVHEAESQDAAMKEQLGALYLSYRKQKYKVAVFHSGHEDLYQKQGGAGRNQGTGADP